MTEIWKPAIGYQNYSVSSFGQVRREISRGSRKQKILKQYKDRKGYMYVCLSVDGIVSTVRVHRLVAAAFVGDLSDLTVNHIDLNKSNNHALNLELITATANVRHAIANGHKSTSGAKIDQDQATEIRARWASGEGTLSLAHAFKLTRRTINRIISNNHWIAHAAQGQPRAPSQADQPHTPVEYELVSHLQSYH